MIYSLIIRMCLEGLYLFSEDAISQKNDFFGKRDIQVRLEEIEIDINALQQTGEVKTSDAFVDNIIFMDKCVPSITFVNGITHTFAYKLLTDSKSAAPAKMQCGEYKDAVLEQLTQNGLTSRADLQRTTNITREGTYSLLAELIERQLGIKTDQSTLTRCE
ncbi:hypothetical protein CSV63_02460 [Sporosarcina sp. P34]|uniref:hypothetical protein n=1 Tax=Sporosarcina sp. P34 TaxID=2048247 RepID=UPI000C1673BA|nr:hypothetical protein [Sporosarcina sp. P34]PID16769.1 hypothetical protein CSV63_02460 [Sporosarcina sp. P34]